MGTITVSIIDDTTPEINEFFVIVLQSVELAADINGGRDFDYAGDETLIDTLPIFGAIKTTSIIILQNDDANGIINIASPTYEVTEGTSAVIELIRSAGTFGSPIVHYTVTPVSAMANGIDYSSSSPSSPATFLPDQSSLFISIPIVDDTVPELKESFTLELDGVANGGSLGDLVSTSIVIESNDNPFGKIRFSDNDIIGQVIPNPTMGVTEVTLTVDRLDGTMNSIDVRIYTHTYIHNYIHTYIHTQVALFNITFNR